MTQGEKISRKEIRLFLGPATAETSLATNPFSPLFHSDYKTAKKLFEQEYLHQKLLENNNNISRTAEEIGMERSHLHKKLKAMDILQ